MQKIRTGATAKKVVPTDTEMHTARAEKRAAKIENMEDIGTVMHTTRVRKKGEETGQKTRGMGTTTGTLRNTRVTNSADSTGSTVSRAGIMVAQLSRAAQLYDR